MKRVDISLLAVIGVLMLMLFAGMKPASSHEIVVWEQYSPDRIVVKYADGHEKMCPGRVLPCYEQWPKNIEQSR